jgi:hypothetical protein
MTGRGHQPVVIWETARLVHAEGSLVRACPDDTQHGNKHIFFLQWRVGPPPDDKN